MADCNSSTSGRLQSDYIDRFLIDYTVIKPKVYSFLYLCHELLLLIHFSSVSIPPGKHQWIYWFFNLADDLAYPEAVSEKIPDDHEDLMDYMTNVMIEPHTTLSIIFWIV